MKTLVFLSMISLFAYFTVTAATNAKHNMEKLYEQRNQAIQAQLANLE